MTNIHAALLKRNNVISQSYIDAIFVSSLLNFQCRNPGLSKSQIRSTLLSPVISGNFLNSINPQFDPLVNLVNKESKQSKQPKQPKQTLNKKQQFETQCIRCMIPKQPNGRAKLLALMIMLCVQKKQSEI